MLHRSWLALVTLAACAPSIEDLPIDTDGVDVPAVDTDDGTDVPVDTTDPAPAGPFVGPDANGVTTLVVDATSMETWSYADFDARALVHETQGWTLAFQRAAVQVNGGVSGGGAVEVAWEDIAFEDASQAPASGWTTDLADADGDGEPELALAGWYDYDPATHALSPHAGTWFVRTAGGDTLAVAFLGYYDAAGTSGFVSLQYRSVDDPGAAGPDELVLTVDASSREVPVWLDLDDGAIVPPPAAPLDDPTWDLSLQRTTLRLNGGANGAGEGAGFTWPDGTAWEDVVAPPAAGWVTDVAPPSVYEDGTALSTWFNYDPATHGVSASGRVHAVRDADGEVWKLQVQTWSDGVFTLRAARLAP